MISRETVTRYTAGDGSKHDTLEAAQEQDLVVLLRDELAEFMHNDVVATAEVPKMAALAILTCSKHVVDILTTTASSLPVCRKVNGGVKKRKPKVVAEQAALPGTEAVAQSA